MTRTAPRSRRRLVLAALLLLAVIAAALAWRGLTPSTATTSTAPTYQSVSLSTFVESIPAPGTLRAWQRRDVRAATGGTVVWTAELGERVQEGDVVARLDPLPLERAEQDARLALERAQRQLDNARRDQLDTARTQRSAVEQAERRVEETAALLAERRDHAALVERLVELGSETQANLRAARDELTAAETELAVAQRDLSDAGATRDARLARAAQDVLDAEAARSQAEVTLQRAQEDLAGVTLVAPIAGVIDAVEVTEGGVVNTDGVVVGVADDRRLALVTQVDETEVGRVLPGLTAQVVVTAAADRVVSAMVTAISPTARTVQNIPVFDVTLEVPNPGLTLRPGMTAEASIVLREVSDTFTVPSRSVQVTATSTRAGVSDAGLGGPDPERLEALRAGADGGLPGMASAGRGGSGGLPDAETIARAREAAAGSGAAPAGLPRSASLRVRLPDGSIETVTVEVITTIGANMVVRAELPAGAEVEVPAITATTSATSTSSSVRFALPGMGGGGGFR